MKKNIAFLLASMFVFSIATNAYASTQSN
ncbi:TPA: heat-stable enterotoxin ST-II, partial [Escherichia coli]|nr:heat-stable enterotoxin ST-II [Escherichia coli]